MPPSDDKPKRRLFHLLQRGARHPGRSATDEGALWSAHQRASSAVRETGDAGQRIASHVAKQRAVVDTLGDRARSVATRSTELANGFGRLRETFERLSLVALNTGLEGARLGETAGQALGLVSEEVRVHATRGGEACRELGAALSDIGSELSQVQSSLDRTRESAADVAQEAGRVGGASADAERALHEIGERLKSTTGSDPETTRAITEALDHARALVTSMNELRGRVPQALVFGALRPVLEPILRVLEGEDEPET